jgi:hypothetical protein
MKRLLAVGILAGIFVGLMSALSTPSAAITTQTPPILAAYTPPPCRMFSTEHVARYAQKIYAGTGTVTAAQRAHLRWEESCLKYLNALAWVKHYAHSQSVKHAARVAALPQWQTAFSVSDYDDSTATASGFHATYGVAVCGSGGGPCVPFGTKIEFRYNGRDVIAVADDHGPYVAGRWFDLGTSTAAALGFEGVADMEYRILG